MSLFFAYSIKLLLCPLVVSRQQCHFSYIGPHKFSHRFLLAFFFIDARAALRHATKWISRTKRDSVFFKSKEGGRGERSGNCRARSVVALYGSRRLYIILISASRSSTRPGFLSSPQSACAPLHVHLYTFY